MDAWIAAGAVEDDPAAIYRGILGLLRPDMMLTITDTLESDPLDWSLRFVHRYAIPTGFDDMAACQQEQHFRHFPSRQFALDSLIPARQAAIRRKRPEISIVSGVLGNARIVGDRILLPETGKPPVIRWCVALTQVRYLLPIAPNPPVLDNVALAILQLIREGYTAKEIGLRIGLSSRTIEHKLERLKADFGARSLAHLITLSLTAGAEP
jgi:DNA-binding CsgD family transcriptional regulator